MCAREHIYKDLEFAYLLVYPEAVYASTREPCCGKIRIFLIQNKGGVYTRNGRFWQEVSGEESQTIRGLARRVIDGEQAPVYTTNSPFSWQ
jgi:hypothetical protein